MRLSCAGSTGTAGNRGAAIKHQENVERQIKVDLLFYEQDWASSYWESNTNSLEFRGTTWIRNPLWGGQVTF